MPAELISSPWRPRLFGELSRAKTSLLIVSPFIKEKAAISLLEAVGKPRTREIKVRLLTNLRASSIMNGSLDVSALRVLRDSIDALSIASFEPLHAKVFVIDKAVAIVGSANLTAAGLEKNAEIGVILRARPVVREILNLINEWFSLADPIAENFIKQLEYKVQGAKELLQRLQKEQRKESRLLARKFDLEVSQIRDSVFHNKTVYKSENQIFSEAVLFVLKHGPLTTREINKRVKAHYSELCDDSIDRVINGVHFGKRWKHCVRNAQQYLKRNGEIRLKDKQWHMID